jgi:hypothetical protein
VVLTEEGATCFVGWTKNHGESERIFFARGRQGLGHLTLETAAGSRRRRIFQFSRSVAFFMVVVIMC